MSKDISPRTSLDEGISALVSCLNEIATRLTYICDAIQENNSVCIKIDEFCDSLSVYL